MREQVPVEKLAKGMFVAELDRPWVGTPFLIQGFVIETDREIQQFQRLCKHVFVERSLSTGDQFIPEKIETKVAVQRARAEPQAKIYKDRQDGADNAESGGLIGSIGKIFKSAFSTDGVPPPEEVRAPSRAAPVREREPVITFYKDQEPAKRPKPQEVSSVREKGMSSEERSYIEQALDPDASVKVYAEKESGGLLGKLTRLLKVSAEEKNSSNPAAR